MNGLALAIIKVQLTLSLKDEIRYEGTITAYAEVVNGLLRRYATDDVIAKGNEEMHNIEQEFLTTSDFSQKAQDLALRCGAVYNEQTLRGRFFEVFHPSIRNNMCRCSADSLEVTLEDQAHLV